MSRSKGSFLTEFVIVTLGVALALAADSAVEQYRERASAREALVNVRRDIGADIEEAEGRLEWAERTQDARMRLRAFWANETEIQDSLQFLDDLWLTTTYLTFDASTAAVEALKSNGGLDLIAEGGLREGLLDYLTLVQNVAEQDVARRAAVLGSSERLVPLLVQGTTLWVPPDEERDGRLRAWAAGVLNSTSLRDSDALRELLLVTESQFGWQLFFYRDLLEDAQSLAKLLDEELGAP